MIEVRKRRARRGTVILVSLAVVALAAAAVAATASARTAGKTISVAIVANPQMQDIASLTPSLFTAKSGISVKYTILDEGKLREVTTRDVGSGGKAFDAVMIGMYEAPQFGAAGLLKDLTPMAKSDKAYGYGDLIPAVRNGLSVNGKLYASPFYAESSFLMYRKDLMAQAGITMPLRPTWDEVAKVAAQMHNAKKGMAGICLRGDPGWGENLAPIDTVINSFGGRWYDLAEPTRVLEGGRRLQLAAPLERIPVLVRAGSVFVTGQVFPASQRGWTPPPTTRDVITIEAFPSPATDSARFLYVDSGDGDREKVIRLTSAPGRSSLSAPPLARGGEAALHLPRPLRRATLNEIGRAHV